MLLLVHGIAGTSAQEARLALREHAERRGVAPTALARDLVAQLLDPVAVLDPA